MIWQDGNYYLIGVDEKSGIVKHYRVDKMLKILTENEMCIRDTIWGGKKCS